MQQLTVPADVWACKQPGVPLVAAIVEGECSGHCGPRRDCCEVPNDPPAWLVALRDARCETCDHGRGSTGYVWRSGPNGSWSEPCPNERCHDGRLLHDVRVEDPDGEHDGYTECRTVRCLVDVVEVDDLVAIGMSYELSPNVLAMGYPLGRPNVYGVPPTLIYDGKGYRLTTTHVDALAAACGKPPADWVGGYAVIVTGVGE